MGKPRAGNREKILYISKVILKELRETLIGLKIVERADLHRDSLFLFRMKDECNQLISIFVKSILTAERNRFE